MVKIDFNNMAKEMLDGALKQKLTRIEKDRLDFGFDSIYFRYAELCDELAMYKIMYEHELPSNAKKAMNGRKMHFYNTLEQLLRAHEGDNNDINK